MGSIAKRPDGKWRARWTDPSGKERAKHFTRKIDAQRFLSLTESDVLKGTYLDPRSGQTTVGELGQQLLLTKRDPNTLQWNKAMLKRVNEPITIGDEERFAGWEHVAIRSVDPLVVQAWVGHLEDSGAKPDVVRGAFRVMHEICTLALRSKRIGFDPCLGVRLPPVARREMLFLTAEQLHLLADEVERMHPGHGWGALVRFAGYSGCRAGEIGGLHVKHLDLLRHRTRITTARKSHGADGAPKTGKSRWVDLPRQLCEELAAHLAARDHAPDARVWTGERGGPLNHKWFYTERFKPVVDALSDEEKLPFVERLNDEGELDRLTLRFHDLRHTCVALLIEKGAQQYEVMEHLGHTNIQTTVNVYGHLFPSVRDRIRGALEDTWSGVLENSPDQSRTKTQKRRRSG